MRRHLRAAKMARGRAAALTGGSLFIMYFLHIESAWCVGGRLSLIMQSTAPEHPSLENCICTILSRIVRALFSK
jgi:hypothetical protein